MNVKIKDFKIHIELTVIIVVVLCTILMPLRGYLKNYFMCYMFIAFHELSHMFTASIFGIKTKELDIRISGLNICLNSHNIPPLKRLLIYLAGPMSNIILALMFFKIEFVFVINIALALINLIPAKPLDGYNILKIVLQIFKLKKIKKIMLNINIAAFTVLSFLSIIQVIILKNPSIFLMTIYIYLQTKKANKTEDISIYQKYYKNVTKF